MVGGDRSFKLALTEKDEEFFDELREDCGVSGDGEKGEGVGRGGEGKEEVRVEGWGKKIEEEAEGWGDGTKGCE